MYLKKKKKKKKSSVQLASYTVLSLATSEAEFRARLPSTDTVEAWDIFLALSEGNEAALGREKRLNLARY